MSESTTIRRAGSIYDLGYRAYSGDRLGPAYSVYSLFVYSLRSIFGIGGSTWAKVLAYGLAGVALVPALVQLAVAALAPEQFEYAEPSTYFGFISIVLVLFCAATAPEIVGRDQRHKTLTLYFSRSLSRADYVSCKLAALAVALFLVQVLPQMVLVLGNAVATSNAVDSLGNDADLLPPILASALLVALFMSSVSLGIVSQTPRRAWSTGALVAFFIVATAVGEALGQTLTGDAQRYGLLISPLSILEGSVNWLFDSPPDPESTLSIAGLDGMYYFLTAIGFSLVSALVLFRQFLRMTV